MKKNPLKAPAIPPTSALLSEEEELAVLESSDISIQYVVGHCAHVCVVIAHCWLLSHWGHEGVVSHTTHPLESSSSSTVEVCDADGDEEEDEGVLTAELSELEDVESSFLFKRIFEYGGWSSSIKATMLTSIIIKTNGISSRVQKGKTEANPSTLDR